MARRKKEDSYDALTVSMPLSITLKNGTTVTGMLWLHPSRRGRFEVEYDGVRKSDGRTDYTSEGHIIAIARLLLRELAEKSN
jgi:hypothetical protein